MNSSLRMSIETCHSHTVRAGQGDLTALACVVRTGDLEVTAERDGQIQTVRKPTYEQRLNLGRISGRKSTLKRAGWTLPWPPRSLPLA